MRIGINAHLLSPDESYRAAGVSNYTEQILRGLSHEGGEHRFRVFAGQWAREPSLTAQFDLGPHFRWEASRLPTQRAPLRILWEQSVWPMRCRNLDITHGMVNVVPLWCLGRAKRVVTIHDLVFLLFGDKHSPLQRRYLEVLTRASVRRADRVIAVSENTRQDVLRLLGADPNKVITVPEAAAAEFEPRPPSEIEAFRQKRELPPRFFFYLGTLEPRKNIPALLRGYALLREQQKDTPHLIIAGPKGWMFDSIFEQVRELRLENHVSFPGFVPRDELALWFNAALAFVYLSEYEGFGLPPLQAMACGIPTVVNDASSLPEVVGDAGLKVRATQASEVANALGRLSEDGIFWKQRSEASLNRAREFSWTRAARETLAVYEAARG